MSNFLGGVLLGTSALFASFQYLHLFLVTMSLGCQLLGQRQHLRSQLCVCFENFGFNLLNFVELFLRYWSRRAFDISDCFECTLFRRFFNKQNLGAARKRSSEITRRTN